MIKSLHLLFSTIVWSFEIRYSILSFPIFLLCPVRSIVPVRTDRASARVNPITVSLDDISEQDEVTGTVVRVSNYGVFIDIGAGVDAFLHRRKMKVNKYLK